MFRCTLILALCFIGLVRSNVIQSSRQNDVEKEVELADLIHKLKADVEGLKDKLVKKEVKEELKQEDEKKEEEEDADDDTEIVELIKEQLKKDEEEEKKKDAAEEEITVEEEDEDEDEEEVTISPEDDLADEVSNGAADVEDTESNEKAVEKAAAKLGDLVQAADLIITPEQENILKIDANPNIQKDAIKSPSRHWDTRVGNRVKVPIFLTGAITGNGRKMNAIRQAIAEYSAKTCIDFEVKAAAPQEHHIEFISAGGCYSLLGKSGRGKQPISIGNGCGTKGIVEHELMHALGFFHEQARPDRDRYIILQLNNLVNPRLASQFRMVPEAALSEKTFSVPYDIGSIMHYGSTAFAKRGTTTILKRDSPGSTTGRPFRSNRAGFAPSDLLSINALYKCAGAPPPPRPTPPRPVTVKPPPRPVPPKASTCGALQRMGMCAYKEVCAMCRGACLEPEFEEWVQDRRSAYKCTYWKKQGYCSETKQGHKAMMKLCPKTCLRAIHPADGPCGGE